MQLAADSFRSVPGFSERREGTGPPRGKHGRQEGACGARSTDGLGRAGRGVPAKGFREETPTRASRDSWTPDRGYPRHQLRRSAVGTAETGRGCSDWLPRPFPVVSPQTEVITNASQRPREGPAAELGAVGGVPGSTTRPTGAQGGERGRLLPPGVRPRPAAPSASRGACARLRPLLAARPASLVARQGKQRGRLPRSPPPSGPSSGAPGGLARRWIPSTPVTHPQRRKEAAGGRDTAGSGTGEGPLPSKELKLS